METDIVYNQADNIAAELVQTFGVRALHFAVAQISTATDESLGVWLAIYMALSAALTDDRAADRALVLKEPRTETSAASRITTHRTRFHFGNASRVNETEWM